MLWIMEETIKERLTAYLRYKGINKSEFGRIIGVSNAYISSECFAIIDNSIIYRDIRAN